MKNKISVGDLVEIDLKVGEDVFQGVVLDLNDSLNFDGSKWYKVKPSQESTMPGNFWYRENKVKKVGE